MNKNFIIFRIKNKNKEMDNHWNIKIWRIKRRIRWVYVILDLRSSCSWLQGFSYSVTQINVDIELVTCYKLPVWWYGVFKRWSLILCNFPEYRRFRGSSCSRRHGGVKTIHWCQGRGPTSSSDQWSQREWGLYNMSVIIDVRLSSDVWRCLVTDSSLCYSERE